ncbi:MAG: helix-turn-helix domain-containing protein [Mycetocola sp.]
MNAPRGVLLALTLEQAAEAAGASPHQIVEAVRAGELRAKALGSEPRILATDLQSWLESLEDWYEAHPRGNSAAAA